MELSGSHGYLHNADYDGMAKQQDKGFLKGLLGGKEGDAKKASPGKASPSSTMPKKFMDMISPLIMMGGSPGAKVAAQPPPASQPVQVQPQPGGGKDKMSTGSGSSSVADHLMARTYSHNSGLTDYVNKMKISEAGANGANGPNGSGANGKRSKLSNDSAVSTSSSMSVGSQMSMQSTLSAGPAAAAAPPPHGPHMGHPQPHPMLAHPMAPLAAAHHPGNPLNANSYTSNLDRLLEAARYCQLPQSGRPIQPMPADPMANPYPGPTILLTQSAQLPPRMVRPQWRLSDYTLGDKLYTGYASTVYKAVCRASGEVVVLKIYHLMSVCDLYKYQIYREVRVHSSLTHENVVHLFAAFQEGDKVILVQEYADGSDLFSLLHKYGGRLSERLAVQLVLEPFLRVLQYLHSRAIIHRDIKPENILFNKAMCLKLGDFGLAIDLREERAVTRAGTLDYMAPEVLRCPFKSRPEENKENERLHYSARVDAWAVGVLTYELLVGFPPFFDQSRTNTEDRIMSSLPVFPANMSDDARSFIAKALSKHATERPTILEMLHHPWIEQYRTRRSMRVLAPQQPVPQPITPKRPAAAVALSPQLLQTTGSLPASAPSSQPATPLRPVPPAAASPAAPGGMHSAQPMQMLPGGMPSAFGHGMGNLLFVASSPDVSKQQQGVRMMPASPSTPFSLASSADFSPHLPHQPHQPQQQQAYGAAPAAGFGRASHTSSRDSNSMLM